MLGSDNCGVESHVHERLMIEPVVGHSLDRGSIPRGLRLPADFSGGRWYRAILRWMNIEGSSEFDPLTASAEEVESFLDGLAVGWPPVQRAAFVKWNRRVIEAMRFRAGLIPPTDHSLVVEPRVVDESGVHEFLVMGRNWILRVLFVLTCAPAVVADPEDPQLDQLPDDLWGSGMQIVRPDDNGDWTFTVTCHVPSEGIAIAAGDTIRSQTAAAVIGVRK